MINNIYIILIILVVLIIYLYKKYDNNNCKDTFQDTEIIDSVDYIESVKENLERELEQADLECSSDFVKVVGENDLNINEVIADLEYKIEVIDKKLEINKKEKDTKEAELNLKFDKYKKYFILDGETENLDIFYERQMDFRRDNNITQEEILSFLNKYNKSSTDLLLDPVTNSIANTGFFDPENIEKEDKLEDEKQQMLILNLLLLNKLNVLINKDEIDFEAIKNNKDTEEANTQIYKKYFSKITDIYSENSIKNDINILYGTITDDNAKKNLTDVTSPKYKEYVSDIKRKIDNIIYSELGYNKVRGVKFSETDDCKTKSKQRVLTNRLKILNDRLYELNEEIGTIDKPPSEMYNSKANIEENIKELENQDYRLYDDYTRHFYDISKENKFINEDIFKKTELAEHFGSTTEKKDTIENKYLFKKMMILPFQYKYFNNVYFIIKKEVVLDLIDLKKMLLKLGLIIDLSLNQNFEFLEKTIKDKITEHIQNNETDYEIMHSTEIKKIITENVNIFAENIDYNRKNIINIENIKKEMISYLSNYKTNVKLIYTLDFFFNPQNDLNIDLIKYELYIPLKKEEPTYYELGYSNDKDVYSSLNNYSNQFGLKLQIKNILKKNEFYQNNILTKDIYDLLENEFYFREGSIFYLMLNRKDLNRTKLLVDFSNKDDSSNNLELYTLNNRKPNNFYVMYDHNSKALFSATD